LFCWGPPGDAKDMCQHCLPGLGSPGIFWLNIREAFTSDFFHTKNLGEPSDRKEDASRSRLSQCACDRSTESISQKLPIETDLHVDMLQSKGNSNMISYEKPNWSLIWRHCHIWLILA
jgi:hypothetical protein